MNNKKLFKGALVLFASILMAVSCQSNSNPDGGDTTTQQPGGGEDKPVDIALTESEKSSDPLKTTIGDTFTAAADLGNVGSKGFAFGVSKDVTGDNYEVTVVSVAGIKSGSASGEIQKAKGTSTAFSSRSTLKDTSTLTGVAGKLKVANITVDVAKEKITLKLKESEERSTPLGTALEGVFEDNNTSFGVLKFEIEVKEKNKPKTAKTLTVYAEIGKA